MKGLTAVVAALALVSALAVLAWRFWPEQRLEEGAFRAAYESPLPPLDGPVAVYHLGHSLVGREMPALLAQGGGHEYALQLGWGASLKNHLEGQVPGMAEENATIAHRPAKAAAASGEYPVFVLTEMVELKDAIRYHDSAKSLAAWARMIRAGRAEARIYLYETWHRTDDPAGWLNRIDADRAKLWEDALLRRAMAEEGVGTIYLIPGGQVMAALVRAAEKGEIAGLTGLSDFIADDIHFTPLGAWAMALTHEAVIYARVPLGQAPEGVQPESAEALRQIVWKVVRADPLTGLGG